MIETAPEEAPVTRVELLQAVEHGFNRGSADLDALLDAAREAGARSAVLETIGRLPNLPVRGPRDLWEYLPNVPVR